MSATAHERRCLEVLHTASVKDFRTHIVTFARDLGFDTVAAMVVTEHSAWLTEFQTVTNAPAAYLTEFSDSGHAGIDPVSQYCKRSDAPLVWDRRNYAHPELQALWQRQEPFGYRSGLAVAMHASRGRHFMFGVNCDKDRCDQVPHFRTVAEDFLSFAEHAQAAAFELARPSRLDPKNTLSLASRELEAIRWTMDGMNSWEVADRMSISERHATLLLRRAMQKLGCATKYECGLAAIRLGLIECR